MYIVEKEIGIDAAHRVPDHRSKCKSLHGHRYRIIARCSGDLFKEGEQNGMVLDFGFLKELMLELIDAPCDHGTILYVGDEYLWHFLHNPTKGYLEDIKDSLKREGPLLQCGAFGKLLIVDFVPTAENLARYWFDVLQPRVKEITEGRADLYEVVVWETPTSAATYTNPKQTTTKA